MHAVVLAPGEGRTLDMGPFRMTLKVDSAVTGSGLTVLEADEPPDFGPPLHIHEDAGEAFYVLAGEYLIFIEQAQHSCPAGSFIYIPAGVEHGFRVGETHSRKLNIYVPSAMEGYFEGLANANLENQSLSDEQLSELAASHFMRVTGPMPEGYV